MEVRIVHLSDLHFGARFDFNIWESLKDEVKTLEPSLLIVSGDLVDDPIPAQLLAARCELTNLAQEFGGKLIVVPGNHDIYRAGNRLQLASQRSDWYYRIFSAGNLDAAIEYCTRKYGVEPSFNSTYRDIPAAFFPSWANRELSRLIPPAGKIESIHECEDSNLLVACLDSNAETEFVGFATGAVMNGDLVALKAELAAATRPHLARIAVVHHHPLPIAFSQAGALIGAEPFMVLHNAGTVLAVLSGHRFDLVLHGHKHEPQYARLYLSPKDADGYPVAVVAAGSASMSGTERESNCFNLIRIEPNGRLVTTRCTYGGPCAPDIKGDQVTSFREPLSIVKQRAFLRSRERHSLSCEKRAQRFEITATGDLIVNDTISGLCRLKGFEPIVRYHVISVPADGWLTGVALDPSSQQQGYEVVKRAGPEIRLQRKTTVYEFEVRLPASVAREGQYTLSFCCGNSVNLTAWQATERSSFEGGSQNGIEEEWVGCAITMPTDLLEFEVKFPGSLTGERPYLLCSRAENYPGYQQDARDGCADLRDATLVPDRDMMEFEEERLSFVPSTRTWRVPVQQPMVGYRYQLRWRTPEQDEDIDQGIQGEVVDDQKLLLAMRDRRLQNSLHSTDKKAEQTLAAVAADLDKLLGSNRPLPYGVELYAYDTSIVALRPILKFESGRFLPLAPNDEIPIGVGIAGSAFQQRLALPWVRGARSPFVSPFPAQAALSTVETILAIPIFHRSQDAKMLPSPWATIGVLSYWSSSKGSRIARLTSATQSQESTEKVLFARELAHAAVRNLVENT